MLCFGDDLIAGDLRVVGNVSRYRIEYIYGQDGITGFKSDGKIYYYRRNIQGDIIAIYGLDGRLKVCYTYDAWGNHSAYDINGTEIYDSKTGIKYGYNGHIGNINPYRYRGYYFDTETNLYYLKTRYYDAETGRFINADDISYLDPESINGLNLYAYCLNNPVMMVDPSGCAPKWWQWLVSGLAIVGGAVLCIVPGAQALGVGLLVAGGSMMASNIMSAAGVDGKLSSIISSGLNIAAGIALMFTPFAGIGSSMIGSGIGGIAGGYISEALGGSFELGSMIGSIAGGLLGGKVYDGIKFHNIAKQGILIGKMGNFEAAAAQRGLAYYKGMPGYTRVEKVLGKGLTGRLGWAHNYRYISNVMKHSGKIYNLGGPLTGSYGKEVELIGKYLFFLPI